MRATYSYAAFLLAALMLCSLAACESNDSPLSDAASQGVFRSSTGAQAPAPSGLVNVAVGSENLNLWPWLTPNGETREDPLNLVFVGRANALQIRSALLALNGDRTAFGMPNVFPFNATWSDAAGSVQAGYAGDAWAGSVIQLQIGSYGPVRFHLRLFETGAPYGEGGTWTLGGAHFEILIPGTPEHQVVSWELAEQIVTVDMIRSGLLLAPPAPTAAINDAPSYRFIPVVIYNGIPDAIKIACGLPPGPTATPVGIPTNGHATVFRLGGNALDPGEGSDQTVAIQFHQIIPKPFCADGPADYFMVDGPVEVTKTVMIDGGHYSYRGTTNGDLTATPIGGGESFAVNVHDIQNGFINGSNASVNSNIKRIAPQDGGSELLMQWLNVGSEGATQFRSREQCLSP